MTAKFELEKIVSQVTKRTDSSLSGLSCYIMVTPQVMLFFFFFKNQYFKKYFGIRYSYTSHDCFLLDEDLDNDVRSYNNLAVIGQRKWLRIFHYFLNLNNAKSKSKFFSYNEWNLCDKRYSSPKSKLENCSSLKIEEKMSFCHLVVFVNVPP